MLNLNFTGSPTDLSIKIKVQAHFVLSNFSGFEESSLHSSPRESGLVFLEEGVSVADFELQVQTAPKVQKKNVKMSFILLSTPAQFFQNFGTCRSPLGGHLVKKTKKGL